jgi:hypothetical protein
MQADESGDVQVELLRTTDPVRAGLVRGVLESEGIAVSTRGLTANGVMPHLRNAIEIVVRVPRSRLEAARRLVAEMEREVEEEPVPAENAPYREAAKRRPVAPSPRLKRIAVVAAFVVPGGAHFYVQRTVPALVVILAYAAAVVAMIAEVPLAGYLLALVWAADVTGAFGACDAARRGEPLDARRHAPVGALVGIGAWSGLASSVLLSVLADPASEAWCRYEARCSSGRTERSCLRDAVNYGPALLEASCVRCLGRDVSCNTIAMECQDACFGERASSDP